MWEALAVGPVPSTPAPSAHGEARLCLYLDGQSDDLAITVASSWWTADGECRESSLSLSGETREAWDLMSEATQWLWKRWKRPIQGHSPFGELES